MIEGLVIQHCLPIPDKFYNIKKRLKTLDEVEQFFLGFLAFIDCTSVQQIPMPKENKRKKEYYAGKKKKKHPVKTQLMVNNRGFIIHKVGHKKGYRHDYDIYKNNPPVTPKQVVNVVDLGGYLGVEKDFPERLLTIPKRKKRNLNLSTEEMEYNKSHSKRGIVIEHTICRLKKYRILADVFRNNLGKHNKVSDIVLGLVNYRIMNHYC